MTRVAWIGLGAVACAATAACASILSIPNDTPSYCSTNTGHTYCEDFDLGDPLSRMTFHAATDGAQLTIAPSDDSPPNLLDFKSPKLGPTQSTLAGYDKEFTSSGFGALHIEADMRVVTGGRGFHGLVGFLLITDKQGGCIGVAMVPGGIGAKAIGNPDGCSALTAGMGGMMGPIPDAGGGGDAGGDGGAIALVQPLGSLPALDQWVRLRVDVVPSPTHDGSGTFTIDVVGQPTSYAPLPIAAGTLNPAGTPLVGFSAAGLPTSDAVDLQFDNITVDVRPP